MTTCERLSERMAAVANGASWSSDEGVHLASCPDCSAEWSIVSQAALLGTRLEPVDHARIAAQVRRRLASEPARAKRPLLLLRRAGRILVGLAAAAVLALVVRGAGRPDRVDSPAGGVLTELDELDRSELESILDGIDGERPEARSVGGSGLGDLTPDELKRVLDSWETS